jgi:holin-like protein
VSTAVSPRRPAIVTVALVFVYLSGLSNAAVGIAVLLSRYRVPAGEVLPVSLLGAGIILFGLLTLAVAGAIARGSRPARLLATVYLVVQLALHTWSIVTTAWDATSIALIAIDLFVIAALWLAPGSRHFRPAS